MGNLLMLIAIYCHHQPSGHTDNINNNINMIVRELLFNDTLLPGKIAHQLTKALAEPLSQHPNFHKQVQISHLKHIMVATYKERHGQYPALLLNQNAYFGTSIQANIIMQLNQAAQSSLSRGLQTDDARLLQHLKGVHWCTLGCFMSLQHYLSSKNIFYISELIKNTDQLLSQNKEYYWVVYQPFVDKLLETTLRIENITKQRSLYPPFHIQLLLAKLISLFEKTQLRIINPDGISNDLNKRGMVTMSMLIQAFERIPWKSAHLTHIRQTMVDQITYQQSQEKPLALSQPQDDTQITEATKAQAITWKKQLIYALDSQSLFSLRMTAKNIHLKPSPQ
ncbi:MAG: hypothetical protein VXY77_04715 [Pseudomonadota bacterium]|nr:hypothetical protein [Pseudomonadota bacterium]